MRAALVAERLAQLIGKILPVLVGEEFGAVHEQQKRRRSCLT